MSSCKTGVRLAYPGHDKVANLHLFPRLMETLPEKCLPVIPLTAPAHTIIMYALWVQATMVLEGVSAEKSAAHHEGRNCTRAMQSEAYFWKATCSGVNHSGRCSPRRSSRAT